MDATHPPRLGHRGWRYKMINYEQNNLGDVTTDAGVVVHLTQQAYLAGSNAKPLYQAAGQDDAGNGYIVTWTPYDNYQELMAEDDESACCDWDIYTVAAV